MPMSLVRVAGVTVACAAAVTVASAVQRAPAPDLVLVNARVFAGMASRPWAEAIAIRGGLIAAVGGTGEVKAQAGAARVIDLGGRVVIPGFNDAHWHPDVLPDGVELAAGPDPMEDPPLETVLDRLKAARARQSASSSTYFVLPRPSFFAASV